MLNRASDLGMNSLTLSICGWMKVAVVSRVIRHLLLASG